jgi:CRISPR-associated protein Cmr6
MNLKHYYFRTYFGSDIKLSQPAKGSEERIVNEKANEKTFRTKNNTLTSTAHVMPFLPAQLKSINDVMELKLEVQNPGLLPGIGYPHEIGYPGEFKLGFHFDHVTGLPVLPGSSVKGVVRSMFPQVQTNIGKSQATSTKQRAKAVKQMAKANFIFKMLEKLEIPHLDMHKAQHAAFVHALEQSIFCGMDYADMAVPKRHPMAKHDVFFDAQPIKFGENQLLGRDALAPHHNDPLRNPTPLPFVKVMPNVVFGFYFRLHDTHIGVVTITAQHKLRLICEILCTVGAGAKTNVGYGQFTPTQATDRIRGAVQTLVAKPITLTDLADAATASRGNVTAQLGSAQTTAAVPSVPKMLRFDKNLKGRKIIGEVVSEQGVNPILFRVLNVEQFDKELAIKVPDALVDRFTMGSRWNLEVNRSEPAKGILEAKVSDFKPIT